MNCNLRSAYIVPVVVSIGWLTGSLWAQTDPWVNGSGGEIYYNGGNVGIGVESPAYKVQINGNVDLLNWSDGYTIGGGQAGMYMPLSTTDLRLMTSNQDRISITSAGNVGIGTTTPTSFLEVQSGASDIPILYAWQAKNNGGSSVAFDLKDDRGYSGSISGTTFRVRSWTYSPNDTSALVSIATIVGGSDVSRLYISNGSGNVGIGTTAPQYTLSVNGTIQAKEVIVNTGWADYVFQPGYSLKPLQEVASYIRQNHHLPDVPSEAEVKQQGVPIGAMQSKLLAKIEELTLHMIQAKEENVRLEQENQALARETRSLEERVAHLEAQDAH